MNIGQRVREAREVLGMQRTVLARRVGVAENTIYRIETAKRTPSVELLEKIARELRTEPAELLREPALAGKAEAPNETGRSTRDAELGEVLENIRHVTVNYENYRRIEARIDEYREAWEKRLAEGKFEKAAVEEAGQAIRAFWPAVIASADAEMSDLVEWVGLEAEEAAATSVLWPAMRRFMALGDKVNRAYRERFGTTYSSTVTELFPQRKAS
jgi:transcriptional regulator with XRE-family HTH domain